MSDLSDRIRKAKQRMLAALDRDIQEFRVSYDMMNEEERVQVANWLCQLAELAGRSLSWSGMKLQIVVSHDFTDEEGRSLYSGSASFNPEVLLRAIESWQRGEPFIPSSAVSML